ncbi:MULTISPECIES: DUF4132 domain-containing protein [Streptomyces]|uniref:DUF4132 domain-containing protein n=1 Tax=Streptomyces virginiae TaxID=1961 RepID=A0ABQ3NYC4_STRVG|nr:MULTISPECIES: DUF4132 domain-containing protein [Streptomyces]KOU79880.1 hypothetical protein ADK94_31020 [Streptomyces sp. XY593]KOU91217.1 hypothetical protein ADK92_32575 [Streptomyces sp. XY533]KOV01737.1 hypothetical protein ADK91_22250 [Streptomyces sp. XY511]KOV46534.1 hypothetical protein ADK98_12390 [Streptomyces sp. H036]MBP2348581.1 hypothetical protein [Streptomyces virginiae]
MAWLAAGEGYEIALVEGRVAARSVTGRAAGRQLKTLPKALKDHPEVDRLRRLAEWLDRHAAACVAQVDGWMVSSLPVPTELLARVWPDEAWQNALRDLAVVGDDPDEVGFLRDATASGELKVVNLDGETVRLSPRTVTLPHPVLLPDLDDVREFAAELGIVQQVEQIHRATWRKPDEVSATATEVRDYAGGVFPTRFSLAARATALGYRVSGGYATCKVRDAGAGSGTEAAVWIGEPYYDDETTTGALSWHDEDGRAVTLAKVGPVAWSEGMRMAAALYAGRKIEEGGDA